MVWVSLIMGGLSLLLQWLISQKVLSPGQQAHLNAMLHRFNEVKAAAVGLGCKPDGEPLMECAEPEKIDKHELDAALKALGKELRRKK